MSRIAELAQNMGITENQYREYKVSGVSEDDYKELIKDKDGETLLSELELKELRDIIDRNEEYTILDFIKERKNVDTKNKTSKKRVNKKAKKEEVKLEKLELTEEEIAYQKVLNNVLKIDAEPAKKEFDRVTIKMEKDLYDKVLYTAHTLNKDVTSLVSDILSRSLESVIVNKERVEQIRDNNKKRRSGTK